METILITGFSGFVASHFVEYLLSNDLHYKVFGLSRGKTTSFCLTQSNNAVDVDNLTADLTDFAKLRGIIADVQPDYLLHLAAFSSVAYSWKHPAESFSNNSNIFLNLLEAVRESAPKCRILSVGSSEEYGNVPTCCLPIREDQSLRPMSPYAVARVSQELLSKVYADAFGMRIIMTRSFNHIGPRQDERFVVPSFIRKIRDIREAGNRNGVIETGDLSIVRDFVDVRDVVEAYYLLLTEGTCGDVYNICSGRGVRLSDLVEIIAREVGVNVEAVTNMEYVRPSDNAAIIGSPNKIISELGWARKHELEDTIRDMVVYYDGL